mmetsp:Transcript_8698/g.32552  ORF Transcript_8698/g.32552 Transcript_8698/m.32552 type:complete len:319 (+) Transcript_8698:1881-2837(+)
MYKCPGVFRKEQGKLPQKGVPKRRLKNAAASLGFAAPRAETAEVFEPVFFETAVGSPALGVPPSLLPNNPPNTPAVALSTAFCACEYTELCSLPVSLVASSSTYAFVFFFVFFVFLDETFESFPDPTLGSAAKTGAFRIGLPMNIFEVTNTPSSRVTVRATTRKSPSLHRRTSNTRSSSTSTHTSPSHRAVTFITLPSGATISRCRPISVRFTTAVSPSMVVSSNTPASRSCASACSSFAFTTEGAPVANALPNASRKPAWLSTACVSQVPLRSGRGSNSPPPGSIVAVVVPTSPRQSRRRRSEARATSGEEFFVTRG